MKQFYLLALFCAVSLMCVFTACDDDDEAATWPDGSEISALYENKSTSLPESNKLMLTYSGGELIGKGVYLKAEENTLVLYNVFPAEKETFIYNVPLTAAADGYTFAGSSTTAAGTPFDYAGKVMPGVMALNLTNVVMPKNTMTGQWKLNKRNPLQIKWEVEPFEMTDEIGEVITYTTEESQSLAGLVGAVLGGFILPQMVDTLTFRNDGNIQADYKGLEAMEWQKSPLNLCRYYVRDNKLYIVLDLQMILKTVQTTKAETAINKKSLSIEEIKILVGQVMKWGQQGIPLAVDGSNLKSKLTLEKEQLLPFFPLLSVLIESIPESSGSDNILLQLLASNREMFGGLINHTTVFEITLSLDPVTAEN